MIKKGNKMEEIFKEMEETIEQFNKNERRKKWNINLEI